MPSIADRLRAEREALGMSQDALAEKCGIGARSQRNYEAGVRAPDAAYLAAIAAAGADVLYILTGQRSQPAPATAGLSPRQRALLDNYEHTDPEGQRAIERVALMGAQQAKATRAASGAGTGAHKPKRA